MFYYFGRKKRIAHLYPRPIHNTIIEPFAGSAAYSLHSNHWENNVILSDTNPTVIGIWQYLKDATIADISALPDICQGQKTTEFKQLSKEERDLIGFHINPGSSVPKITCVEFSRWKAGKQYIIENIHKIKHWTIIFGSFTSLINQKATWFIDPPYQQMGKYYASDPINFQFLSSWSMQRLGQIIVCEAVGANWLPFNFLGSSKNIGKRHSNEIVFTTNH